MKSQSQGDYFSTGTWKENSKWFQRDDERKRMKQESESQLNN